MSDDDRTVTMADVDRAVEATLAHADGLADDTFRAGQREGAKQVRDRLDDTSTLGLDHD